MRKLYYNNTLWLKKNLINNKQNNLIIIYLVINLQKNIKNI